MWNIFPGCEMCRKLDWLMVAWELSTNLKRSSTPKTCNWQKFHLFFPHHSSQAISARKYCNLLVLYYSLWNNSVFFTALPIFNKKKKLSFEVWQLISVNKITCSQVMRSKRKLQNDTVTNLCRLLNLMKSPTNDE